MLERASDCFQLRCGYFRLKSRRELEGLETRRTQGPLCIQMERIPPRLIRLRSRRAEFALGAVSPFFRFLDFSFPAHETTRSSEEEAGGRSLPRV